jgi:hypothetical protein
MADYPDSTLILCTALSQQPWDTDKVTYKPVDMNEFLAFAGIDPAAVRIEPVMAEQFSIVSGSAKAAADAEQKLAMLEIDGKPLFIVENNGTELFVGCSVMTAGAEDRTIVRASDGTSARFGDMFFMLHSTRSGKHHADGVLWIRNGAHEIVRDKVPLTRIAPTILAAFGLRGPAHMTGSPLSA